MEISKLSLKNILNRSIGVTFKSRKKLYYANIILKFILVKFFIGNIIIFILRTNIVTISIEVTSY